VVVEVRRVLVGRFCTSSSVSSSTAEAASTAFSLPLPLLLAAPVSASTVVLLEEAEEERARFDLLPAAETAVDEPEENDGDRSRARRAEEREGDELTLAFLFPVSLVRARDVPAGMTSSFVDGCDSGGSEEVIVSGLGVASTFPGVSCGVGVVDMVCVKSEGPASFSIDTSNCSMGKLVSPPFSFSSDTDFLIFLRAGSGASEGSLVLSSWISACTGLRFLRERRVGTGGNVLVFPPCDLAYSFWIPVSCHSISWTPSQVIGVVEMGEGFMANERGCN
jgi:hypothetical protein